MSKAVSKIFIDRILEDIDKTGLLPWQKTYKVYYSFNYFGYNEYRGINRLLLPPGEYITKNQIQKYNKEHDCFYKFKKGIRFYPVYFFTSEKKVISLTEVKKLFPDADWNNIENKSPAYIGSTGGWYYVKNTDVSGNDIYYKRRNVSKYYSVAERQFFVNEDGEELPSRVSTGDVVLENAAAENVVRSYLERSGVNMETTIGYPMYIPMLHTVRCNITPDTSANYYSNLFHELAHSTMKHLNRKLDTASEECVAEICASFCCSECGITEYSTANSREYDNTLSYVSAYKKMIEDWGEKFISIVAEADKAFRYIMNYE